MNRKLVHDDEVGRQLLGTGALTSLDLATHRLSSHIADRVLDFAIHGDYLYWGGGTHLDGESHIARMRLSRQSPCETAGLPPTNVPSLAAGGGAKAVVDTTDTGSGTGGAGGAAGR